MGAARFCLSGVSRRVAVAEFDKLAGKEILRRPSDVQIRELVQVILAVPGKPMDERRADVVVDGAV